MNRRVCKLDELGSEIARITIPAALALAADPLASLVDTAFIGQLGLIASFPFLPLVVEIFRNLYGQCKYYVCSETYALHTLLGSVELAGVGVSIAIFNQFSKIAIYPLVSVTTSFVAEEDAICSKIVEEQANGDVEKAQTLNTEPEELNPNTGMCIS